MCAVTGGGRSLYKDHISVKRPSRPRGGGGGWGGGGGGGWGWGGGGGVYLSAKRKLSAKRFVNLPRLQYTLTRRVACVHSPLSQPFQHGKVSEAAHNVLVSYWDTPGSLAEEDTLPAAHPLREDVEPPLKLLGTCPLYPSDAADE